MARYIDADKFSVTLGFYERAFDENRDFSARNTILQIMHELKHAPTADVVEVKHGEWKNVVVYNDTCIATCSNCGRQIVERECNATSFKLENEFCRKCGADMRGGKNDL